MWLGKLIKISIFCLYAFYPLCSFAVTWKYKYPANSFVIQPGMTGSSSSYAIPTIDKPIAAASQAGMTVINSLKDTSQVTMVAVFGILPPSPTGSTGPIKARLSAISFIAPSTGGANRHICLSYAIIAFKSGSSYGMQIRNSPGSGCYYLTLGGSFAGYIQYSASNEIVLSNTSGAFGYINIFKSISPSLQTCSGNECSDVPFMFHLTIDDCSDVAELDCKSDTTSSNFCGGSSCTDIFDLKIAAIELEFSDQ